MATLLSVGIIGGLLLLLAALLVAAYFLARGVTAVLNGVVRRVLGRPFNPLVLHTGTAVCMAVLLFIVPMRACEYQQVRLYERAMPAQLNLERLIFHDERMAGLLEGCGVAIFRLSDATLSRIRNEGLSFLETARARRDGNGGYEPWRSTPVTDRDWVFRGASCASGKPDVFQQAERAVELSGSFFTIGHECRLVIIPSLGIAVFSHDG